MNAPPADADDYMQFLLATQLVCPAVEAARVQPCSPTAPDHDAFTRLLTRLEPDSATLWAEVAPLLPPDGVIIVDDTTLDKPCARRIQLVTDHWSGKHKGVVSGIYLVTAVWSDGGRLLPIDYRIYHPAGDNKTKNDHFADMLTLAKSGGLAPRCVLFDGWYASLENFKHFRELGWVFLTRLKSNRLIRVERGEKRAVADQAIAPTGRWLGCRDMENSRCSGSLPKTAWRSTGRRVTWR